MITNNVNEIWKPVKDYVGIYEVSNLGQVKSVSRIIVTKANVKKHIKEKILNGTINNHGYVTINLAYKGVDKKKQLHQLIAESFLDSNYLVKKLVVDHIDNNKTNNNLSNLQVITFRENKSKDTKNKYTKFTGVTWHKGDKKWQASISINNKSIYLGQFDCQHKASVAYQQKLKEVKNK